MPLPVMTITIISTSTNVVTETVLFMLRIISPSFILFITISLLTTRRFPQPSLSPLTGVTQAVSYRIPRRCLILSCLSFSSFIHFFDGLAFVIYAAINKCWPQDTGTEINALIGLVAFSSLAALGTWKDIKGVDVWLLTRMKILIFLSLIFDVTQEVLYETVSLMPKNYLPHPHSCPYGIQAIVHCILPLRILLLVLLFFALINPIVTETTTTSADGVLEDQSTSAQLLSPSANHLGCQDLTVRTGAGNYGTFDDDAIYAAMEQAPNPEATDHATDKIQEPEVDVDPAWSKIFRRLRLITPYLWPKTSHSLHTAFPCTVILILGRFVNIAVPWLLANLITISGQNVTNLSWPYLFGYITLRFLRSVDGLPALRNVLWTSVMRCSDCEMSRLSFNHLPHLPFAWHTHRQAVEVLRFIERFSAINDTVQLVLFDVIPSFVDIVVALIVFTIKLDWMLTAVTCVFMSAYVVASVLLARWRTQLRHAGTMNGRDTIRHSIYMDCLLDYDTVQHFNGEEYEDQSYRRNCQKFEHRVITAMNLLNLVQNFIITVGLLVGSMIAARLVVNCQLDPRDFLFFIAYLAHLYGPLNVIGSIYRPVTRSLVDAEKLLDLFNEPTDVNDLVEASDPFASDGETEINSVNRPSESSSANAPSTTSALIDSDAHGPAPPLIPTFEAIPGEVATTVVVSSHWPLYARKALDYLISKHPKVMSTISIVLIWVGRIASVPGISACIGGTILAHQVVQAAGAITIAAGEWLQAAVDSAATGVSIDARPSGEAAIEDVER